MTWKNFDGKPYTRAALAAHIEATDFSTWRRKNGSIGRPKFIVLHNTSVPTIKQWLAWDAAKRQQYIKNMEPYYAGMGWRGGPHFFVPPQADIAAFGFNDLATCGTHASCFNSDSIGIEMVGEFNVEPFDSGPGAMVRDNAVFLLACLHKKLGLTPEPYVYGSRGLHFHIECKADNHDCPGKFVHKSDVVAMVTAAMAKEDPEAPLPVQPPPLDPPVEQLTKFIGITATSFGGTGDHQASAYGGMVDPDKPGVALPYHFPGVRPKVRVMRGGATVDCDIVDVGPWYPSARGPADPYWKTSARPRAESDKRTNKAGIDLTPAAWKALGEANADDVKALVDWQFV